MEQHRPQPPSNTMLVPYGNRELAAALPFLGAPRFRLPRGWGVKEVIRPNGTRSDTYYYEPGSGRQFRSKKEVLRHLNGESTRRLSPRNHNSGNQKMVLYAQNTEIRRMIVSGRKLLRVNDELNKILPSRNAAPNAPYILPEGWIVEEVPRKYNCSADRYYYEPGTGQKFRSLVSVGKYLAELDENAPLAKALEEIKEENKPLSKVFKLENHAKSSSPKKKTIVGVGESNNKQASTFNCPPMKVTWVLGSTQGDVWNPFISETVVPDSVKQQWADRFAILMNDVDK